MRILLVAMPDTASSLDRVMKFPNLGLCSIAAQVPDHEVRILDLVLRPKGVRRRVLDEVAAFSPDLVGYSAMSFQYATARTLAGAVRAARPGTLHVLGGYHATVLADQVAAHDGGAFDFIVRGEGELAFRQLVDVLAGGAGDLAGVPGLSWRGPHQAWRHNPEGRLLELDSLPLPRREARAYDGAFYFDRRFDVAETTRGCPLPCTFCSIRRMYGRTFRKFPIPRVIADLRGLERRGVRGVFFVDDNVTIDVPRFKELCEEIAAAGLSHLRYIVQASVHGIAKDPTLAPAMARAGFDTVFMGIENAEDPNVAALDIGPKLGKTENETPRAVRLLRDNGIKAVGGFIVGNPDDDRGAIRRTFRYARRLGLDFPIVQCLTPYPRTEMREALLTEGLVTNADDLTRYNGYMVNVRTRHLSSTELVRAMTWENLKLYYDPGAARRSRFFHDFPAFRGRMFLNNLALFAGARNRLFHSTHTL
ncbi:MAG TPA: radical SAM protein [Candidatus Binatus sp.]|nr:radical SAM protein [Candidatus Binatus sp.]